MKKHHICVLGGTGFLGQALVHALAAEGHEIVVPSRRPERCRELSLYPNVSMRQANIHLPEVLDELIAGADTVINLVDSKKCSGSAFDQIHTELTRKVLKACEKNQVSRLLQWSAVAQDTSAPYFASKEEADKVALSSDTVNATVLKTSWLFGEGTFGVKGDFLSEIQQRLKMPVAPFSQLQSKAAPIYFLDVVEIFKQAIDNPKTFNQSLTLCGTQAYTLKELVEWVKEITESKTMIREVCSPMRSLMNVFARDVIQFFKVDAVCDKNDVELFDIELKDLKVQAEGYLSPVAIRERYHEMRKESGRH